jgi:hypothetical protein
VISRCLSLTGLCHLENYQRCWRYLRAAVKDCDADEAIVLQNGHSTIRDGKCTWFLTFRPESLESSTKQNAGPKRESVGGLVPASNSRVTAGFQRADLSKRNAALRAARNLQCSISQIFQMALFRGSSSTTAVRQTETSLPRRCVEFLTPYTVFLSRHVL